ncbi:hypothetical protein AVEN_20600-1 [Araneus ventricosus]|uniref:Uncharacterized protein n=1 Tax=Araneus ventricosus TaxID=182803 RepID=A0A4Y2VHP7_ARAVE|nr:hypothetical protein AVEN_20600-1 [Araneus ventricosus]
MTTLARVVTWFHVHCFHMKKCMCSCRDWMSKYCPEEYQTKSARPLVTINNTDQQNVSLGDWRVKWLAIKFQSYLRILSDNTPEKAEQRVSRFYPKRSLVAVKG